ncbi:hypothetical protein ACFRR6_01690 [Streptomyces sp. NPDC056891]|uniref:hypothetical protein n=1 Tax=Streptomyces sp. NPDC056891 TaxID=3345961 RepID=UPI0036A7C775
MPPIRIESIPTSQQLFPRSSHPDLHPSAVHHGWNLGRQLLLHAHRSSQANTASATGPARMRAIDQLRSLGNIDEAAGPLAIALYLAAVEQAAPTERTDSLAALAADAVADLGAWGVTAPTPPDLEIIARALRALSPCMPD